MGNVNTRDRRDDPYADQISVHTTDGTAWILLHREDFELVKSCDTFEEAINRISGGSPDGKGASDLKTKKDSDLAVKNAANQKGSARIKAAPANSKKRAANKRKAVHKNEGAPITDENPSLTGNDSLNLVPRHSKVLRPGSLVLQNPRLTDFQQNNERYETLKNEMRNKRIREVSVELIREIQHCYRRGRKLVDDVAEMFTKKMGEITRRMSYSRDVNIKLDFCFRNIAGEEIVRDRSFVLDFGPELLKEFEGQLVSSSNGSFLFNKFVENVAWDGFYGKLAYGLVATKTSPLSAASDSSLVWRLPARRDRRSGIEFPAPTTEAEFFKINHNHHTDSLVLFGHLDGPLRLQVHFYRHSYYESRVRICGCIRKDSQEALSIITAEILLAFESFDVITEIDHSMYENFGKISVEDLEKYKKRVEDVKRKMVAENRPSLFKEELNRIMTASEANYAAVELGKQERLKFVLDVGSDSFMVGEGKSVTDRDFFRRRRLSERSEEIPTAEPELVQCLDMLKAITSRSYQDHHKDARDISRKDGDSYAEVKEVENRTTDALLDANGIGDASHAVSRGDASSATKQHSNANLEELTIDELEKRRNPLVANLIVVVPGDEEGPAKRRRLE